MNEKILIPVSILVGSIIVGLAVYFAVFSDKKEEVVNNTGDTKKVIQSPKKVGGGDYILGNKNADVFIIEYSDLECPFCKKYNDGASKKLKKKYLKDGKVAFVFRLFPLRIHPSSFGESIAAQCSGKLGGTEKFFKYVEKVFEQTNSDGKFGSSRLHDIAKNIGLDSEKFIECLKDKKIEEKVRNTYNEGLSAGVKGTPTVFIQLKSGETFPAVADFKVIDDSLQSYFKQKEATKKITGTK